MTVSQAGPRDPDNFPFVVLGNKIDRCRGPVLAQPLPRPLTLVQGERAYCVAEARNRVVLREGRNPLL